MILYIHGFRSTPNSPKAQELKTYFGAKMHLANFSHVPIEAIESLEKCIIDFDISGIVASSLGGFYATYLSEKYHLKSVLINPSTRPFETLSRYLGVNETYDGVPFVWQAAHEGQLKAYVVEKPTPVRYFVMLQKGDKILDYRVAERYYAGATMLIEEGGAHPFDGLGRHLDKIRDFLSIKE